MKKIINSLYLFNLIFIFFAFISFIYPNTASAGTDVLPFNFECNSNTSNGTHKICNPQQQWFGRYDYTSASVNYEIYGHRHGDDSIIYADVCIIPGGQCRWSGCWATSCGVKYNTSTHVEQLIATIPTFTAYYNGNLSLSFSHNVTDAESRVTGTGYAEYPEPPVVQTPVATVPMNFRVFDSCDSEDIYGAGINLAQNYGGGASAVTDVDGRATINVTANTNIGWTASASSYNSTSGTTNSAGGNVNVNIYLTRDCGQPEPPEPPPPPPPPPPPTGCTGNCAQFISQSVPATASLGSNFPVTVTMKNIGTTVWAGNHRLGSQNPQDNATWGLQRVYITDPVNPGESITFTFFPKAPSTAGNYNFQWRMVDEFYQWFGDFTTNVVINVPAPADGSTFVSQTVNGVLNPATITLNAGQTYPMSVVMRNSGTSVWFGDYYYGIGSANPLGSTAWTTTRARLPLLSSAPVGTDWTFSFNITAPTTPGTYNLQWRTLHDAHNNYYTPYIPANWFGASTNNVVVTVVSLPTINNVTISAPLVQADNTTNYSIVVTTTDSTSGSNINQVYARISNAGSNYRGFLTWATSDAWPTEPDKVACNSGFAAVQSLGGNSVYGHQYIDLISCSTSVSGATRTTTFVVRFKTAFPLSPITGFDIQGTARNAAGFNSLDFLDRFDLLLDKSTYVSQSVPSTMIAGQSYPVSVTMQNSGTATWQSGAGNYALGYYNPLVGNVTPWGTGTGRVNIGSNRVTGDSNTFSYSVTAPSTPGTYRFQWQMVHDNPNTLYTPSIPATFFGDVSPFVDVVVSAAAPSVTLTASPSSITSGGSSTLTWTVSGSVTSCTASGSWSGSKSTAGGSQSTGVLSSSQTYNLSCTGPGGTTVATPVTVTVTAPSTFTLSISSNPSPTGHVSSSVGGISCGTISGVSYTSCVSSPITSGTTVVLTPTPASSYWRFSGWSGDCTGSGACSVVVNSNKSVTANFVIRNFNYNEF